MGKRLLAVIAVFVLAVTAPFTSFGAEINTLNGVIKAVEGVISYKYQVENVSDFSELLDKLSEKAGTYSADWYYIAFSQYGLDCDNSKSVEALKNKIETFYSEGLSNVKVTDMQRVAFALSACKADITDINGHNLLADCTYNYAKVKPLNSQGVNAVAYALLLLDSKNYQVPDDAETSRDKMIELILKYELNDGGFALFGDNPDVDITSIVMQSLAPYKNRAQVKKALDKCLSILSKRQDSTGGYKSFSNQISCESTAQVVLALASMGISPADDSRFVKNGKSVLDGMMVFNLENGAFSHFRGGSPDNMATYQALCALVGTYRLMSGEKTVYDFSKKANPNSVSIKKKSENSSSIKAKNNSEKENKSTTVSSSESVEKNSEKAKPKSKKTNSSSKSSTSETLTNTSQDNPTFGTKAPQKHNNSTFENKPVSLYLVFISLLIIYISIIIVKRRKL